MLTTQLAPRGRGDPDEEDADETFEDSSPSAGAAPSGERIEEARRGEDYRSRRETEPQQEPETAPEQDPETAPKQRSGAKTAPGATTTPR